MKKWKRKIIAELYSISLTQEASPTTRKTASFWKISFAGEPFKYCLCASFFWFLSNLLLIASSWFWRGEGLNMRWLSHSPCLMTCWVFKEVISHCSAVEVLDEGGEIYVSLCRGQGGTPADRPCRKWHDSWQVVAMAACADLVLQEVIPFVAQSLSDYSSTGFR